MSSDTTLRLAYREFIGFARALARQGAAYAEQAPGFRLESRAFDVPQLYDELVSRRGARSSRYDLCMVVTDWLPELIRNGLAPPT